jgi:hypothetical protein
MMTTSSHPSLPPISRPRSSDRPSFSRFPLDLQPPHHPALSRGKRGPSRAVPDCRTDEDRKHYRQARTPPDHLGSMSTRGPREPPPTSGINPAWKRLSIESNSSNAAPLRYGRQMARDRPVLLSRPSFPAARRACRLPSSPPTLRARHASVRSWNPRPWPRPLPRGLHPASHTTSNPPLPLLTHPNQPVERPVPPHLPHPVPPSLITVVRGGSTPSHSPSGRSHSVAHEHGLRPGPWRDTMASSLQEIPARSRHLHHHRARALRMYPTRQRPSAWPRQVAGLKGRSHISAALEERPAGNPGNGPLPLPTLHVGPCAELVGEPNDSMGRKASGASPDFPLVTARAHPHDVGVHLWEGRTERTSRTAMLRASGHRAQAECSPNPAVDSRAAIAGELR